MNRMLPAHLVALLALQTLYACGGGIDGAPSNIDTLFDGKGRPSTQAQQAPESLAVRTRAGLYATPQEVDWQLLIAEPYTAVVDVDAHASVEQAAAAALRIFRWSSDGALVAFFVRGSQPAQAAAVADALTAGGVTMVFLVSAGHF